MDLTNLWKEAARIGLSGWDQAADYVASGSRYLSQAISSGFSLFGSTERLRPLADQAYDEKHYFLVPFLPAESNYAVYTMRCLPREVAPINDLPKRRVLHLPQADALDAFEALMKREAREGVEASSSAGLGGQLNDLADQIDKLDDRVFHGLLLIGGLVALVNPVAGAVIAAKSLIPSGAMLLSKFGLRSMGETLNSRKLEGEIRQAERDVLAQFRGTSAVSLVNPVLGHLQRALETTGRDFEPLHDVTWDGLDFAEHDRERFTELSFRAVCNVYERTLLQPAELAAAQLGEEDVAWLNWMRAQLEESPGNA